MPWLPVTAPPQCLALLVGAEMGSTGRSIVSPLLAAEAFAPCLMFAPRNQQVSGLKPSVVPFWYSFVSKSENLCSIISAKVDLVALVGFFPLVFLSFLIKFIPVCDNVIRF